jgi:hypothetical protein
MEEINKKFTRQNEMRLYLEVADKLIDGKVSIC